MRLLYLIILTHQSIYWYIVISYCYTISWQKSLPKSQACRCLWHMYFPFVIICQPIKTLSISLAHIQFSLSILTKNMFCLRNERSTIIVFYKKLFEIQESMSFFKGQSVVKLNSKHFIRKSIFFMSHEWLNPYGDVYSGKKYFYL